MQEFALELIKKGTLTPGKLATEWEMHKRGRYAPAASRDRFGLTAASYKVLRKLRTEGLITSDDDWKFTLK